MFLELTLGSSYTKSMYLTQKDEVRSIKVMDINYVLINKKETNFPQDEYWVDWEKRLCANLNGFKRKKNKENKNDSCHLTGNLVRKGFKGVKQEIHFSSNTNIMNA